MTAAAPLAGRKAARAVRWSIPREHGAWAMLLLPLFSALVLARSSSWMALSATLAALGVFLLKEPLLVLARQVWIWKEPHPEAWAARRCLLVYGSLTAAAGAWLSLVISPVVLLGSGAAALLITSLAVYLALANRQRSVLLQLVSAVGLSSATLFVWLAVRSTLDPTVWWLWAAHAGHSAGALLAVRARLEAVASLRSGGAPAGFRFTALFSQAILVAAALVAAGVGRSALAAPLLLSAGVHLRDLAHLRDPVFLRLPLRRVGQRELAFSTVFSVLVLVALW